MKYKVVDVKESTKRTKLEKSIRFESERGFDNIQDILNDLKEDLSKTNLQDMDKRLMMNKIEKIEQDLQDLNWELEDYGLYL